LPLEVEPEVVLPVAGGTEAAVALAVTAMDALVELASGAFTSAVADVWWVGGLSSVRCCKRQERRKW